MRKILLVEDNEFNRDMLSRRLQRYGYDVVIAVNGRDGVEKAHVETPDVILMDLCLPELNGWEAVKQIRSSNTTKEIPLIALTAHAMVGDREKALEVGCDDYDTKPVNMERLLAKLEQAIQPTKDIR